MLLAVCVCVLLGVSVCEFGWSLVLACVCTEPMTRACVRSLLLASCVRSSSTLVLLIAHRAHDPRWRLLFPNGPHPAAAPPRASPAVPPADCRRT